MALKACDSWGEKQFWAPDIIYTNGLFYLSYSVEEHLCIGTSRSPPRPLCTGGEKASARGYQGN